MALEGDGRRGKRDGGGQGGDGQVGEGRHGPAAAVGSQTPCECCDHFWALLRAWRGAGQLAYSPPCAPQVHGHTHACVFYKWDLSQETGRVYVTGRHAHSPRGRTRSWRGHCWLIDHCIAHCKSPIGRVGQTCFPSWVCQADWLRESLCFGVGHIFSPQIAFGFRRKNKQNPQ